MKPKFADIVAWEQAELLMQPVFIRLIDNLRKQLDQSNWGGTYTDVPLWAAEIPAGVREKVANLTAKLKTASPEQAAQIEQALAHLPAPSPGYQLHLRLHSQEVIVDLWDLCYQICFRNYNPQLVNADQEYPVEIDTSLIDETGEVDWDQLDTKTRQIVEEVFNNLPDP